jgi:hypothetical protein
MVTRNTVSNCLLACSQELLLCLDKMTSEMQSTDDVLRKKVLVEINEDFHQADKLNFALDSGILTELVKCFTY